MKSGVLRAAGFQDVETGDPDFDRAFVLKAQEPRSVGSVFDDAARQRIRVVFDAHDAPMELALEDGTLRWSFPGWVEETHARIVPGLELLAHLAWRMGT